MQVIYTHMRVCVLMCVCIFVGVCTGACEFPTRVHMPVRVSSDPYHVRAGGEVQQVEHQPVHLRVQRRRWVHQDGLQAGQGGQLHTLIWRGQGFQQEGEELQAQDGWGQHSTTLPCRPQCTRPAYSPFDKD